MLLILLIFLNINTIFANEEDSFETRYIDLLPEDQKKEFIHRITRRILEEVETQKNESRKSGEVPDSELEHHAKFVEKLLKEESDNLRRRRSFVKTKRSTDTKGKHNKRNIDLTLRDRNGTQRTGDDLDGIDLEEDRDVKYKLSSEEIKSETVKKNNSAQFEHGAKTDTLNDEDDSTEEEDDIKFEAVTKSNPNNVSIEIEIIEDKVVNANNQKVEIPVQVIYDDAMSTIGAKGVTKRPKTISETDIKKTSGYKEAIHEVQSTTSKSTTDNKNISTIHLKISSEEDIKRSKAVTQSDTTFAIPTVSSTHLPRNATSTTYKVESLEGLKSSITKKPNLITETSQISEVINLSEHNSSNVKKNARRHAEETEQLGSLSYSKLFSKNSNETLNTTSTPIAIKTDIEPNVKDESNTQSLLPKHNNKETNLGKTKDDIVVTKEESVEKSFNRDMSTDTIHDSVLKTTEDVKIIKVSSLETKLGSKILLKTTTENLDATNNIDLPSETPHLTTQITDSSETEQTSKILVKTITENYETPSNIAKIVTKTTDSIAETGNSRETELHVASLVTKTTEYADTKPKIPESLTKTPDTSSDTANSSETEQSSKILVKTTTENNDATTQNSDVITKIIDSTSDSVKLSDNKVINKILLTKTTGNSDTITKNPDLITKLTDLPTGTVSLSETDLISKILVETATEGIDTTKNNLDSSIKTPTSTLETVHLAKNKLNSKILVTKSTENSDTTTRNPVLLTNIPKPTTKIETSKFSVAESKTNDLTSPKGVECRTEFISWPPDVTKENKNTTAKFDDTKTRTKFINWPDGHDSTTEGIEHDKNEYSTGKLNTDISENKNDKINLLNLKLKSEITLGKTTITENTVKARTEYITGKYDTDVSEDEHFDKLQSNLTDNIVNFTEKTTFTESNVKARTEYTTGKYDTDLLEKTKQNKVIEAVQKLQTISTNANTGESDTTVTEDIIKARTVFITGKYDSDVSEEMKQRVNSIVQLLKPDLPKTTTNVNTTERNIKLENATAILMEPGEDNTSIDSEMEDVTTTPGPVLTTTERNNGVKVTFYKPFAGVKNENEITIFKDGLAKTVYLNTNKTGAQYLEKNILRTDSPKHSKEVYRVYEVPPEEQAFASEKVIPKVKLMDVKDSDILVHKDKENKQAVGNLDKDSPKDEEVKFVPVYNYAPENAYYNPINKFGPNEPGTFIDTISSNEKDTQIKGEERGIYKTDDNKIDLQYVAKGVQNKELDTFFDVTPLSKPKLRQCSSEETTEKIMQVFPNSISEEHAYNSILNNNKARNHLQIVKQMLHDRNYFENFRFYKPRTDAPYSSLYPMMPPFRTTTTTIPPKKKTLRENKYKVNKSNTPDKTFLNSFTFLFNNNVLNGNDGDSTKTVDHLFGYGAVKRNGLEISDQYTENTKKRMRRDKPSVEYEYYTNPKDVSSDNEESLKIRQAFHNAIGMSFLSKPKNKAKKTPNNNSNVRQNIENVNQTKPQFPDPTRTFSRSEGDRLPNFKLQNYVQVIQDMVKMDNTGLEKYNWLTSSVDIRTAIKKMISLCETLRTGQYIHPKDLQLIKYMLYIYKTAENLLEPVPKIPVSYRKNGRRSLLPVSERPWTVRPSNQEELNRFEDFWMGVEYLLDDLHDAIKHIALITRFKHQHWFKNLKELYLTNTTRKQALEVLLHLATKNIINLVENSAKSGLEDNYVKYAMQNNLEIESTKDEMSFLAEVYNELKKEL